MLYKCILVLISNLNSYYINIWTSCWYQCYNDYNINCVHYCCNIDGHWVSTHVLHTLANYYVTIIFIDIKNTSGKTSPI